MSGIEIAGLVLGAFPLLISAAEDYKSGLAPLRKWKRFRTEFIDFINSVKIEKIRFETTIECLLISVDIPPDELELLLQRPDYEGWEQESLLNVLKDRLGRHYDTYMSIVRTIYLLLDKLNKLLELRDGKVDWANTDTHWWEFQLKRLRLCFRDEGEEIVTSLTSNNRMLETLTETKEKLKVAKSSRADTGWAQTFENIKCHARSLYTALSRGWSCTCASPHFTALRLQQPLKDISSPAFKLAIGAHSGQMQSDNLTRREVIIKREISINERQTTNNMQIVKPGVNPAQERDNLDDLRRDFEALSSKKTATTTLTVNPSRPDSRSPSPSLTTFKRYLSRSNQNKTPSASLDLTGQIASDCNSIPCKPLRPKKQARFHIPTSAKSSPAVMTVVPDTTANVDNKSSPALVTVVADIVIEDKSTTINVEITDLCLTLRDPLQVSPHFGYLRGDEQRIHELHLLLPDRGTAIPHNSLVTLESILSGTQGIRLTRLERFQLASILASSLLQLQDSAWLSPHLSKKDILFSQQGSKVQITHPYISHSFTSSHTNPPLSNTSASSRIAAKNSLSNLGILLLEVGFWQAIETSQMRASYLIDGQPHPFTDRLTAIAWLEMMAAEEPDLERIIECCLNCHFEVKADWNDKRFTQAVYRNVVGPLEEIVRTWPS